MDFKGSSFVHPNEKVISLQGKDIDLNLKLTFCKGGITPNDIWKILEKTENKKKDEFLPHIILYKTPLPLCNTGNDCYMNSSFQALLPTISEELRTALRNARKHKTQAIELFNNYLDELDSKKSTWTPSRCIKNLKYFSRNFRYRDQEDAQEFLNGFLDRLREEFDTISEYKVNRNPIRKSYAPSYDCRYYCSNCGKSNIEKPQILEELTFFLEISSDNLQTMLDNALRTSINSYNCLNCKTTNGHAKMSAVFTSLPSTFICCAKRFKHAGFSSSKSYQEIKFTETISLPFKRNDGQLQRANYDLSAVVIHLGGSLNSGHYECISRLGDQWYRISDFNVSRINKTSAEFPTRSYGYIYIFNRSAGTVPNGDLKRKLSMPIGVNQFSQQQKKSKTTMNNDEYRKRNFKPFFNKQNGSFCSPINESSPVSTTGQPLKSTC